MTAVPPPDPGLASTSRPVGESAPRLDVCGRAQVAGLDCLLGVEDVALILNKARSWVYDHATDPPLNGRRLGKHLRFEPDAVERYKRSVFG